ncbi:MAG: PEP-CTERM sorting domain-containing protein [Roseibacillus sp.]
MKNTIKLPLLVLAGAALATSSASAVTLLVNFGGGGDVDAAVAGDYAVADPAVDLAAPVVFQGSGGGTAVGLGMTVDISTNTGNFTPADTSIWGTTPILDSYLSRRDNPLNVTVTGIEELAPGTTFDVTVYGVGDATDQWGPISVTYNGVTTAEFTTVADPAAAGNSNGELTHETFTLTKVAGVDSVVLNNSGVGGSRWQAINGFSITGTPIPEPSSALLVGLAGFAFLRRRR